MVHEMFLSLGQAKLACSTLLERAKIPQNKCVHQLLVEFYKL